MWPWHQGAKHAHRGHRLSVSKLSRRAVLTGAVTATGVAVLGQRLLADDASKARNVAGEDARDTPQCGMNVNNSVHYAARRATFGGVGVARVFHPTLLPARWTGAKDGLSDTKRAQISFKVPPARLAAGDYDAKIIAWLTSIPAGWTVWLTFWHEPGDELRAGRFTAAEYRAAWRRLSDLVRRQARLPDVDVYLAPVFGAYQVDTAGWADSWVPAPTEVDLLCWDMYGNPTGGPGLSSPYPNVQETVDKCLYVTERLGFTQWGVSEFNAPRRVWDASESARVRWLEEFRAYCWSPSRGVAPQLGSPLLFLLWEGEGTNWDQTFKTAASIDWWTNVLAQSR